MHKLIVSETPTGSFLNCKLDKEQQVNIREIELFNSMKLSFALPFTYSQVKNHRVISFNTTEKTPLKQYLKAITNKQKFFDVVAAFIKVLKECEDNKLFLKNLLLEFNYIFVDNRTKKISFAYIPIIDFQNITNIPNALKEIAFSSVFTRMENSDYIKKYLNYFNTSQRFSLVEFEAFVKELSEGLYKVVKGISSPLEAQSGPLADTNKCKKCGNYLAPGAKFCTNCGQTVFAGMSNTDAEKKADLVYIPNIKSTSIVGIPTSSPLMEKSETQNFGGTTVLGEDSAFGTTLLSQEELQTPTYPYLIRVKNGEKINIDKPVFRIGKEKSYVDYFISDNAAVSRSHADIVVKGNEVFIIDHNSTNKTYLNGTPINPKIEFEIIDEIKIRLANEEFVFHLG